MLKFLRTRKKGMLSWLIIGGIILTFTAWGYFRKSAGPQVAAKVNGDTITVTEFLREYQELLRRYQAQFKDKFTEELAGLLSIKNSTLENMINKRILIQAAENNNIIITDQDVANSIQNSPIFKDKEGNFDRDLYKKLLRINRYTETRYEKMIRDDLYIQKIMWLVKNSVRISPLEIEKQFILENNRVTLEYIELDPHKLNIKFNQKEIANFIKEKEHEIEKYYQEHLSDYQQSDRVKASHILVKIKNETSEEVAAAKKKILDIAKKVTPKNFAKMAKKYSEGPTAAQNGELGIFDEKTMDPEFTKVAFSLKPGVISQPVKSQFGWHLILVEKKLPAFKRPLNTVRKDIAHKILEKSKQKLVASEKARELLKAIKEQKKLNSILKTLNLKWKASKPFKYGSYIEGIGKAEEVIAAAFKLKKVGQLIPRFFLINDNYYFFKLKEREHPDMKKFETSVASLSDKLIEKKERIFLNEWQEALKKNAKILKNPAILISKK